MNNDTTLETVNEDLVFSKPIADNKVGVVVNQIDDYEHSILEVDTTLDARLLKLMTEKKRIDAELELVKDEIMLELQEFANKYGESENFNITLAKRTTYKYSDVLTKTIKQTNDDFKILKQKEEKTGVATPKITEYLLIKPKK